MSKKQKIVITVAWILATATILAKADTVLMIGDSLTCGPFGDQVRTHLVEKYGKDVHVLGSCGSSPSAWMKGYRDYRPKCGTRGFEGVTPKIETLIAEIKPDLIIVQQGTNDFDGLKESGVGAIKHVTAVYREFCKRLVAKRVVWISPPDSSKFGDKIKQAVDEAIILVCKERGIEVIQSSKFTKYIPRVSGSDGVHYGEKGALLWSREVNKRL